MTDSPLFTQDDVNRLRDTATLYYDGEAAVFLNEMADRLQMWIDQQRLREGFTVVQGMARPLHSTDPDIATGVFILGSGMRWVDETDLTEEG